METISAGVRHTRSISRAGGKDEPPPRTRRSDKIIGIILLLLVVLLWTSSNFVTASLFEGGFEKPFLVTYLNTSSFSLYLVPWLFRRWWKKRGSSADVSESVERGRPRAAAQGYQPLHTEPQGAPEDDVPSELPSASSEMEPLTLRETVLLALTFCFFWFVANWSVNASLDYTTVASATILSSVSGFFTLALGRLLHVEALTIAKVLAVIVSFIGVVIVSLSDSSSGSKPSSVSDLEPNRPLIGDALALLGALFYAIYVLLLKVKVKEESRLDMQLFFGFVGLFNILTCWPIGIVLHYLGIERFELPSSRPAVIAVLINMTITLLSDYLYVLAMLKTTPVTVTVGLSLTIPLAVVGDFALGTTVSLLTLGGAFLVVASFVAVAVDDKRHQAVDQTES